MAGVSGCIKYAMFIFNFFFWVCGTLVLGLAIWMRVSKDDKEIITSGDSNTDPVVAVNLLIAVGSIIMILGFLGCCGAIKESRCMLLLFFIGLLLILLLQVASGILAVTFRFMSDKFLNETVHESVSFLSETGEKEKMVQDKLIALQKEFQCCGLVNGAADWGNNFQNSEVLESCKCPDAPESSCVPYQGEYVYKQTCFSFLEDYFGKITTILIILAFGLAVIEIIGLVFSMVLYCQIGKK